MALNLWVPLLKSEVFVKQEEKREYLMTFHICNTASLVALRTSVVEILRIFMLKMSFSNSLHRN
jgi:hypothetical protein